MKECPTCNFCFDDEQNRCPRDGEVLITINKCRTILGDRYILENRLGEGGMGAVFKAKHRFLKSSHAVKIISPEVVKSDPTLLVRFTQEAILAASIHHPNVISVTDFGVENEDTLYLVMEYIKGISLDDYLRENAPLSVSQAFEFLTPILMGVGAAHAKGITHRDLKPLNVMLKKGKPIAQAVKVLDFGLAKIKSTETFSSFVQAKTTNLLGSPHYMPPEQWANENVDNRSDIYSLGVILFKMLTGEVPFRGDSIPSIMYQHLQAPTPAFASFGISAIPHIEAVVRKALSKDQNERYATVEEFLSEYEKALFNTTNRSAGSPTSDITINLLEHSLPPQTNPGQPREEATGGAPRDQTQPYNLPYLNARQNETLADYFNQPKAGDSATNEQLEQEFFHAQSQVEEARTKISEAEKLALEFNEAQRAAEGARYKALQAQKKLEEDVHRRLQADLESKLTVERQARERAEAEAHHLLEEAKAREQAEARANASAKAALEAQERAEAERRKAEDEAKARQLEEGTRRRAEEAALKLAVEAADARKRYEEAKKAAESEAYFRMEAEIKRQKVEEEIRRLAEHEAERRKAAETQAAQQIQEQASRLESQALEAQQKADEARRLAETEAQKREQAETARKKAEQEARRLAEEIIQAQKRLEEAEQRAKSESEKRAIEEAARKKAEESIRTSPPGAFAPPFEKSLESARQERAHGSSIPEETSSGIIKVSSGKLFTNTASTATSGTGQIPRRKSFYPLVIAGVFLTLLLAGGTGLFLLYLGFSQKVNNVSTDSNIVNASVQKPPAQSSDRLNAKMILIPGGTFQMGRDDVKPETEDYGVQYPAHPVTLSDFYIDRTEVSNEEYAEFLRANKLEAPKDWRDGKPIAGQEKLPVTNVSNFDARKFADWISKRDRLPCQLPTEEEWEYAARSGNQQNIYPWGNDWAAARVNINSDSPREVGTTNDETAVGGVKDMLGNVMEWTATSFNYYAGYPGPKATQFDANSITVRGVSYESTPNQIKNHPLLLTSRRGASANEKRPYLGFRLVCHPQ